VRQGVQGHAPQLDDARERSVAGRVRMQILAGKNVILIYGVGHQDAFEKLFSQGTPRVAFVVK
jgi:hypothetical protein